MQVEPDQRQADPIDNACEHEQRATEIYVALQRAKSAPEQVQTEDGTWPFPLCRDCDEPIEPARLLAGRRRCFLCQSDKESREKRGLR